MDEHSAFPESANTANARCSARTMSYALGMKHEDQTNVNDFPELEIRRKATDWGSPVFNLDNVSGIKQEEDSDSTETADSEGSDVEEHARRKTSAKPSIELQIKAEEACCGDGESSGSTSGKSESAAMKEELSELSTKPGSYKYINCEKQAMHSENEGNVLEYRLDRISLYETGFCVIIDPIVPQGVHPASVPYNPPKVQKKRQLYECNECKKCFNDSAGLRVHQRIHTGERPFQCPTCEKRFIDKYRLVNHIMIHTGERPHKCKKCNKSFNQRPTLKKHQRTHERKRN